MFECLLVRLAMPDQQLVACQRSFLVLLAAQCLGKDGAAVMVSDIDDPAAQQAVSQLSQQGIKASFTHCDVSKKDQVQNLISQTVQQLGGVDILVANAGVHQAADD